jgi:ribokinase
VRESQAKDDWLAAETLVVLQMEVPPVANWRLIERARLRRARVLLNLAPAGPVPASALRAVNWLVANEGEIMVCAAGLELRAADPVEAARAVAAKAGTAVVVTLGGGAFAFAKGEAWRVGALPITPVDTVGAGDAFVGVFAAAMDAGAPLPDALHRASVAGGLACLVRGAQPSLPTMAAIEARLGDLPPAERTA